MSKTMERISLPRIENYGKSSSDNYGAHTLKVITDDGAFYFSYQTVVAFRVNGRLVVRENVWGTTTGKHLNWIDGGDKKSRVSEAEFKQIFAELTGKSL